MKSLTRKELKAALVPRRPDDHKGVFGHVLIAAGSRGMLGAAILTARAALRSGAGLVTLAIPGSLQDAASASAPEALTLALPENSAGALVPQAVPVLLKAHQERSYTVLALGPGLSQNADTRMFVFEALASLRVPAVVDADALNSLAAEPGPLVRELFQRRGKPCVFTPHPGEMARCLGVSTKEVQDDRESAAARLALQWSGIALLKGHGAVISSGTRTVKNATGGSGLAKGGTGDVLTGLIAGLWAQMLASGRVSGDTGFLAAALGAHVHGAAGDKAEKLCTPRAMTAQSVIDCLPEAFKGL